MKIIKLNKESRDELRKTLAMRSTNHFGEYENIVRDIIEQVKAAGDSALFEYTKQFDHFDLNADNIRVTEEEIDAALKMVDNDFIRILQDSANNIKKNKSVSVGWIPIRMELF